MKNLLKKTSTTPLIDAKSKTKRFLTLLELMLVISIIASLMGLLGVGIKHLIEQQRFYSAASSVSDKISTAQNLMMVMKSDFTLKFSALSNHSYRVEIDSKTPITLQTKRLLEKHKIINGIAHLHFISKNGEEQNGTLELFFSTLERSAPFGQLTLTSSTGEKKTIDLPIPFFPLQEFASLLDSETYFPIQVREQWSSNKK